MSELMYTTYLFALQKQINIVLGSTSTFIGLILLTLVVIGYTANSRRSMVIGFLSVILGLFLFSKGVIVSCGCDFGADPGGCSQSCAFDWENDFFTLEHVEGVWGYWLESSSEPNEYN